MALASCQLMHVFEAMVDDPGVEHSSINGTDAEFAGHAIRCRSNKNVS